MKYPLQLATLGILVFTLVSAKAEISREKCAEKAAGLTEEIQRAEREIKEALIEVVRAYRSSQTDAQISNLDKLCATKAELYPKWVAALRKMEGEPQVVKNEDGSFSVDGTNVSEDAKKAFNNNADVIKDRQTMLELKQHFEKSWANVQPQVQVLENRLNKSGLGFDSAHSTDLIIEISKPMKEDTDLYSPSEVHHVEVAYTYCNNHYSIRIAKKKKDGTRISFYVTPMGLWHWQYERKLGCPAGGNWGEEFKDFRNLNQSLPGQELGPTHSIK